MVIALTDVQAKEDAITVVHQILIWGTVCEPTSVQPDPSSLVVDLRRPPEGWTPTRNLLVALPGKWTTAWRCADQVIDALT